VKTIGIVRPAAGVEGGNHVTAQRWEKRFRELGHGVFVEESWSGRDADVLVALHAEKSRDSVDRFRKAHRKKPLVVAAAGTDLYGEGAPSDAAKRSFLLASRVVVLQPRALADLPADVRERARVVHQSVELPERRASKATDAFQVAAVAHLRAVKDPLLPAEAARSLPATSRIRVVLAGGLLDESMDTALERELEMNPRFRWAGDVAHAAALDLLAASHLFVASSRHEGGSNVVSEALALGLPILATRIPGNVGMLGEDHPGFFPVGDARALAELIMRAESSPSFLHELEGCSRERAWTTDPELERESWRALLAELVDVAP
jgi:putative glycosyltransferase (TIGR04348 family)